MKFPPVVVAPVLSLAAALAVSACAGASETSSVQSPQFAQMPAEVSYLKPGGTRSFHVKYVGHVTEVPEGTKLLRVWLPVPQSTEVQSIANLRFAGGAAAIDPERKYAEQVAVSLGGANRVDVWLPVVQGWSVLSIADVRFAGGTASIGTESKYGNKVAYFEFPNPASALDVSMEFDCTRTEQVSDLAALASDGVDADGSASVATFLRDDQLTVVDDRVRSIAGELSAGKTTTLEKARAFYDYTVEEMTYDKSGTGWGRGDTKYACDVGKGNCTDFHALFMSLCRASRIPAGFEIGLYLPYEAGKQEPLGGYHCWAFFRVPGKTWVPVDASEASRIGTPELKEYFFGAHTPNRVTLSVGRDLVLTPAQAGAPLNFFLNPYAEADGKPVKTSKDWEYQEL